MNRKFHNEKLLVTYDNNGVPIGYVCADLDKHVDEQMLDYCYASFQYPVHAICHDLMFAIWLKLAKLRRVFERPITRELIVRGRYHEIVDLTEVHDNDRSLIAYKGYRMQAIHTQSREAYETQSREAYELTLLSDLGKELVALYATWKTQKGRPSAPTIRFHRPAQVRHLDLQEIFRPNPDRYEFPMKDFRQIVELVAYYTYVKHYTVVGVK